MPSHDIESFRRGVTGNARNVLRAFAVVLAATTFIALASGTALAATSGGSAAPTTGQQQTTGTSHPSGGAAAQPTRKKKRKAHKASHHVKLPAELKKIAMCESGDNPRAVSPSGRYRGKYQFDMETWRSMGGKGDPAKAPEWYQDKIALKLYRERGTAPWPNCA